jgi:ligand-binding sensor domain-containing protein
LSVGPDGVVWGASPSGLVRFDPVTETTRIYGLADGLLDDSPYAVLAHSDGTIWVGHIGTSDRQGEHVSMAEDGSLTVLEPIDFTESAEIASVVRLGEQPYGVGVGDVWMGTNEGLCVYDSDIGVFAEHAHPTHPHGYSSGVAFSPDGDIWNGDEYQLSRWHYSDDGDLSPSADLAGTLPTWPVEIGSPVSITDLDADGSTLWVTSALFGVAEVAVGADVATSTVTLLGSPFPTSALAVRADGAGNVWIGSTFGLYVYNNGALTTLAGDWIPASGVDELAVDKTTTPPTVWAGTADGLVKIVGIPE